MAHVWVLILWLELLALHELQVHWSRTLILPLFLQIFKINRPLLWLYIRLTRISQIIVEVSGYLLITQKRMCIAWYLRTRVLSGIVSVDPPSWQRSFMAFLTFGPYYSFSVPTTMTFHLTFYLLCLRSCFRCWSSTIVAFLSFLLRCSWFLLPFLLIIFFFTSLSPFCSDLWGRSRILFVGVELVSFHCWCENGSSKLFKTSCSTFFA